jgi:CheY-like chemotaxis protein/HPt (histidine-containing phosphotransfer) domain-containing protein
VVGQKAQEKDLEFLISAPPGVPPNLVGDPLRLGQILINLVNNALKFTERGEVVVTVGVEQRTSDRVELAFSVRDTGIGMTPEQLSRLFQAFSQADTSTTRKFGGTGLGLSISKRLVEMMDGQIWAESEAGRGSTFRFTAWFGVGAEQQQKRFVPDLAGIRALVVDDNAQAREILSDALRGFALRADVVASGQEAIQAVKGADSSDPYHLVLMDWNMPGMDGIQASAVIRRDSGLKNIPRIVMVTAFGREEIRNQAEQIGIDAFLTKPVSPSALYDTMMEMFGAESLQGAGPVSHRPGAAEHDTRGVRVLLVEDNDMNQQVATELLESAGATVKVADHGGIAVKLLQEGPHPPPFDIVLMDLQMPEMDGFTATRILRADPRFNDLPIIAMTAHALVEERERCLQAGMVDHVTKPIDPDALFAALAHWTKPRKVAAAAAPSAPPATVDDGLPGIEGVDIAGALKRVVGNQRLYRSLMEQFATKQSDMDVRIAEALAGGDRQDAERLAHTLKGVAGNLGIGAVQAAAAKVEKAIREEDSEASKFVVELKIVLAPQVAAIRSALGGGSKPAATAATFNSEAASRAARHLMSLIEANDGDSADAVQEVAMALAGKVDPVRMDALRDSVNDFDFEGARTSLTQIAADCHLSLE